MTFTIDMTILLYLLPLIALAVNIWLKNKIARIAVFCYYILLICLRWQVGVDFTVYLRWINAYAYQKISIFNEPLSVGLIKLSGFLHFPRLFFIVGGLFYMGTVFFILNKTEKRYKDLTFLVLMAACLFTVFAVVRQYMAVACTIIALHYLLKKKYLIFFILSFAAFLFHISSIILLLIPVLVFIIKKVNKLVILIVPPILSVVIPLILPLLEKILGNIPLINNYAYLLTEPENAALITLNPFTIGITIIISFGVWYYIDQIREENKDYDYQCFLIGVIGLFMLVITSNIHAGRIGIAPLVFGIPVFVRLIYKKNILAITTVCIICIFGNLFAYPWACFPYNTRSDVLWDSHTPVEWKKRMN